jgi:hypothetical protein
MEKELNNQFLYEYTLTWHRKTMTSPPEFTPNLANIVNKWLGKTHAPVRSDRLPCGCIGECDSFAHDTAWDFDGTPSRPSFPSDYSPEEIAEYLRENGGECQECGAKCEETAVICLHCATENAAVEALVNELIDERLAE